MEISPPAATLDVDLGIHLLTLSQDLDEAPGWVWDHLVDPDLVATWSPCVPDHPLATTGPVTLRENPGAEPVPSTVLELVEGRLLTHTWGPDTVTWTVEAFGPFSSVSVRQAAASRESALDCAAGWHLCLEVLARRAAGEDAPRVVGPDALAHGWAQLRAGYAERFAEAG